MHNIHADAFYRELFLKIYSSNDEIEVSKIITEYPNVFQRANWQIANNKTFLQKYGAENAAQSLVQEIEQSIKSVISKRLKQIGYHITDDLNSLREIAFPDFINWNTPRTQKEQAKDVQILADGERLNPSITIYDNGFGYSEEEILEYLELGKLIFQSTLQNRISHAINFCGDTDYGYMLFASHKNGTNRLYFTILMRNKLPTGLWRYQFLKIKNILPSFEMKEIELNLFDRIFQSGSLKKLYSYKLPKLCRSVISRDLRQSLNEFYFNPPLPFLTVDRKYRYPNDILLERELYGLDYELNIRLVDIIKSFGKHSYTDEELGILEIEYYIFKEEIGNKNFIKTKQLIKRSFFMNKIGVAFTYKGIVFLHQNKNVISDILNLPFLEDYLLIRISCDKLIHDIRNAFLNGSDGDNEIVWKINSVIKKLFCELGGVLYEENWKRRLIFN